MEFTKLVTVTFTLFAVIDIIGSIPVLIAQKNKTGDINSWKVTLASGILMILFLYVGRPLLKVLTLMCTHLRLAVPS
jgi:multiple antibiotic resistance protein